MYCVFLTFPIKVSESRERGDGDYHELRSGRTNIETRFTPKVTTTKGFNSEGMLARRRNEKKSEISKDVRSEITSARYRGLNNNYL